MRKVYVIQDARGWLSSYYFTSLHKAENRLREMVEKSSDLYDLPLSVREFSPF